MRALYCLEAGLAGRTFHKAVYGSPFWALIPLRCAGWWMQLAVRVAVGSSRIAIPVCLCSLRSFSCVRGGWVFEI